MSAPRSHAQVSLLVGLLLLPAAHPLLRPWVGVPSHLLWLVHVFPVALLTFQRGRRTGLVVVGASVLFTFLGERAFGAGYGVPADVETAVALSVALLGTNGLVFVFALYARGVSARYRVLFEGVQMAVFRFDRTGRVASANPAACRLFGGTVGELTGLRFRDVFRTEAFETLAELEALGGWTGTLDVGGPSDRRRMHVFLLAAPGPEGEGHQLLVADRSLEVLQEREIERQAKLATLGEALAGVAHELRNPLTVIMSHAELGREGAEDSEQREAFDLILEASERMRDLTSELLGFSRIPEGDETVEVHRVLERISRVQTLAVGRSVTLETRIEWEGEVGASPAKLEQILVNLVSNAAYALGEGGGTIALTCRRAGDVVEIEVSDDGPGIRDDVLPRLFEPFVTTKPEGEGTGLGLAISQRLARSWGGELVARNPEQGGATFTLRIPLDTTEAGERVSVPA